MDHKVRHSASRPPVAVQSLCSAPPADSITVDLRAQPNLSLRLRLSPSGRRWFLYCMWLQNLCCFPSRWPSGLSEGAMGLLQDTGHIRKGQGTVWFHRSSSQSETPPLRVSLGLLAESPSLHCFLLGERKKKKTQFWLPWHNTRLYPLVKTVVKDYTTIMKQKTPSSRYHFTYQTLRIAQSLILEESSFLESLLSLSLDCLV